MDNPTQKCKNCELTKEDHYAPWKVTDCKFQPIKNDLLGENDGN